MKITLTESFQRDVRGLSPLEREQLFSVILKLPQTIGEVHQHTGIGLRKIHPSGIYEARIGLGLRTAFGFDGDSVCLHRVGSHDEIRRYLKTL